MVKVSFIWHDCFVVETDSVNMVFDYWRDCDGNPEEFPGFLENLSKSKPLLVFISHGHKDHFNPSVFAWANRFENIRYIVSKDVMRRIRHIISPTSVYSGPKADSSQVTALRPGESFKSEYIGVHAFPSTDIGNSYLVEADGLRIFHAGDLNAWIWPEESTEAELKKAMGDFRACLREIKDYLISDVNSQGHSVGRIDFCFFPVDSRIGGDYFTGARLFVHEFNVKRFFPMHFDLGDQAEREKRRWDAINFLKFANKERGEYIPLVLNGSYYLSGD